MSSVQLSDYCRARLDGVPVEDACAASGIGIGEAELWEKDRERGEADYEALARAPAPAREDEQSGEREMDDIQTSIRVNGGPEIPINLDDIDDPANADAREAIGGFVAEALNAPTDAGQKLKLFIERAERLDEEIKALNEDKSGLFKEMKSDGFDTKTIKRIIKLRKMEPHARKEAEALLSTYMDALGMTPIEAAIALAA